MDSREVTRKLKEAGLKHGKPDRGGEFTVRTFGHGYFGHYGDVGIYLTAETEKLVRLIPELRDRGFDVTRTVAKDGTERRVRVEANPFHERGRLRVVYNDERGYADEVDNSEWPERR